MKRIMILGGSRYILPLIEAAHKLNCRVITCDYLPSNVAHKYSDEYCNVSIIEKDSVLKVAHEKQIDGIMSFACDPGVVTAAYVAEKMGLPSVGTYEAVSILQNKGLFRKFLGENGFNVPTAKHYHSIDEPIKDIDLFHWPVVVKPTDSAGSKGVTRVDDPISLKANIEHALQFSHSHEYIIEDYLQQLGYSSDTDCFSVNGELRFVSFDCQLFDKNAANPYTPAAYCWPSSMPQEAQDELSSEIQRLISLLNLKTSIYNIETRLCVDGKPYIMECSPRGGGNRLAEMLRYATGIDMITNAVRAAIGETCIGIEQKPYIGSWAEVILHSDNAGTFEKLWISDEISKFVVERDLWVEKGQKVGGFTGANEAIGTLVLNCDSTEQVTQILSNQNEYIRVQVN